MPHQKLIKMIGAYENDAIRIFYPDVGRNKKQLTLQFKVLYNNLNFQI